MTELEALRTLQLAVIELVGAVEIEDGETPRYYFPPGPFENVIAVMHEHGLIPEINQAQSEEQ